MNPAKPNLLPPDMTLKVFALAKKKGLDVRNLSASEYRDLALEVRSMKQKIVDGVTALESRVATSDAVGWRVVPLTIYNERRAECESNGCGSFGLLAGGVPVCHACNCADKFLDSKWKDARQKCPKKRWDRYKPPSKETT